MKRLEKALLATGVVAAAGVAIGAAVAPRQAMASYLAAITFALTTALGALSLVVIAHTSNAAWLVVQRRIAEAVASTLPLLAALFVPIAIGARALYPWAEPKASLPPALLHAIEEKHRYLALPGFCVRGLVYLASWIAVAALLRRWSRRQDEDPSEALAERQRMLAGASLPVLGLTGTFAAFDWVMSLDPAWSSTTFGLYVLSGAFAGGVAVVAVLTAPAHARDLLPAEGMADRVHALGRLLFASVCVWAYIAFTQFLIQWIADIPEEIRWYHVRGGGAWGGVAFALGALHFVIPFFALLSRPLKRNPRSLAVVACVVLFAHALDLYWVVLPSLHPDRPHPHLLDLAAFVAVVALPAAFAIGRFRASAPMPLRDPRLDEGLRYESP